MIRTPSHLNSYPHPASWPGSSPRTASIGRISSGRYGSGGTSQRYFPRRPGTAWERHRGRGTAEDGRRSGVAEQRVRVVVDGRELQLTNLHKVLYPQAAFTKADVIDYYTRIAPAILPHLANRPVTLKRNPNGVDGPFFFEKNKPSHTPDWVRTVRLPVPGSTMERDEIDFVVCDDRPTLVWLANLAALELHVPQWTVRGSASPDPRSGRAAPPNPRSGRAASPDPRSGRAVSSKSTRGRRGKANGPELLVFDLDPGAPASIVECAEVACMLRDLIAADGLTGYPKTSGNKGMQVYAPIAESTDEKTSGDRKSTRL